MQYLLRKIIPLPIPYTPYPQYLLCKIIFNSSKLYFLKFTMSIYLILFGSNLCCQKSTTPNQDINCPKSVCLATSYVCQLSHQVQFQRQLDKTLMPGHLPRKYRYTNIVSLVMTLGILRLFMGMYASAIHMLIQGPKCALVVHQSTVKVLLPNEYLKNKIIAPQNMQ